MPSGPPTSGRWSVLVLLATVPAVSLAQDSAQTLAEAIPPAGFGTLHQEDVSLRLQAEHIQVTVLPLDERVIRLLATDSYRALHGLKALKQREIEEAARRYGLRDPTLFIVTFFGLRERAPFNQDDVSITNRGRFFRPIVIVPLTPRWGEQQLAQRETAIAIYLYDPDVEVLEPFRVTYGAIAASGWERTLRRLDEERAAVLARAAAAGRN